MEKNKKNSNYVWAPLMVTLILVIGFGLGIVAQRYLMNSKPLIEYINREDPIDEIVNAIKSNYVDNVSPDTLYSEAVKGILNSLDPFTVYMSAQQIAKSEELLSGNGKGIGIEYVFVNDTMVVSYVNSESPAFKSGLKIGDQIIEVNKNFIAGPAIGQDRALEIFKNIDNDTLNLSVIHFNDHKESKITLIRDNYKKSTLNAAFLLTNDIGYIKFNLFSNSIYNDIVDAIEVLQAKGMKSLILDIRNNGGGYFDEAILLADEFIEGEKLIVYTNGKRDGNTDYKAGIKGVFEKGQLIILVNSNSASSSEVLAGAIQDWDRGIIIGENTFGKGLVQEQFNLSDGSAIRLTTAKYFTPSGRSIQKPYKKGGHAIDETEEILQNVQQYKIFKSLVNQRPLKGMGGIMPDILIQDEINTISQELRDMMNTNVIENFVNTYYFTIFKQKYSYAQFEDFYDNYDIDPAALEALYSKIAIEDAINTKKILSNKKDISYLKKSIKAKIARLEFDNNAYYRVMLKDDAYITKSLEILTTDQYSKILKN